ncbi:Uncharacterized protein DAT39_018145 [Clarias magur]|uniref:Uncharacterized protein n=1 Tax=Clarias magur TaxID=1594786 RepID=A0A8J4U448_CLAMG|nr:Uncharacterized protein DAT39_018145 [Clarias magur]
MGTARTRRGMLLPRDGCVILVSANGKTALIINLFNNCNSCFLIGKDGKRSQIRGQLVIKLTEMLNKEASVRFPSHSHSHCGSEKADQAGGHDTPLFSALKTIDHLVWSPATGILSNPTPRGILESCSVSPIPYGILSNFICPEIISLVLKEFLPNLTLSYLISR